MLNNKSAGVVACLLLAGGVTACSSTDAAKSAAMPASTQAKTATKPAPQVRSAQWQTSLDACAAVSWEKLRQGSALQEIFLSLIAMISVRRAGTLKTAADWLKKNSSVRIEVEGHCDDRGTNEYNLALGAKRAQTAKDYLETLGVAAGRLSTTSYGEEIPVCREHSESCWSKNRRDRFVALNVKPGV